MSNVVPLTRRPVTRVVTETDDGELRDITDHPDAVRAMDYIASERGKRLDAKILDAVGGWETEDGRARDGLVRWACGAEFRGDTLVLYLP